MFDARADEAWQAAAEMAVPGSWLLEQFAPDLLAMLQTAPDAADLSRLAGLAMQGVAEVARDRYRELGSAG
jgi:hypothetical protein